MNRFKQALFCLAAVMAVPMLFAAEPTISLTATPRYPWNGLVDLAFTIDGDDGVKYDTSFVAKDLVGNTNLTLKTLYKSDGKIANAAHEQLFPGAYNWVWDAPMDCSSRWVTYAGCAPTASAVLFSNVQLSDISEFYATHCGTSISDKTHRTKGTWIKADGTGKSVQFSVSDGGYSKSVCMHFEQSGANVVGYVKWARYVSGEGHHEDDFDANSASKQNIATTEVMQGYGLCGLDARVQQSESSVVYDRVVVEGLSSEVSYTYSVKFNANGGSGTMANETLTYGVAKALTANTFTRTGYTFQGWATTSNGAVVYSDKQSVSNLTVTPNATVNLYAVWKASGVQLWANGPYWAECNVGATKPEEYGYYFYWGGTKAYKRVGDKWNAVDGSETGHNFGNCPTYQKTLSWLETNGYIDSAGNLVAKYDAATVYLGNAWRMPTKAECQSLVKNCTIIRSSRNGVKGILVTGKGTYASKSIFLPLAGHGNDVGFYNGGGSCYYWSSTPAYDDKIGYYHLYAWMILSYNDSDVCRFSYDSRFNGNTIRAVVK